MYEAQIETSVVAAAIKAGWSVFQIKFVGRRGAPDRMFARKGRIVFIEFKRPEGEIAVAQEKRAQELRKAGLQVYFCSTEAAGRLLLDLPDA